MLMFFQNSEQAKFDQKNTTTSCQNSDKTNNQPGSLSLYSDPEMERFFTKGIRGGQSFISQRYAKGNDDPKKEGAHLLYIDGKIV